MIIEDEAVGAGIMSSDGAYQTLSKWRSVILNSINTMRLIAGTTEHEFLQIGSQLQSFYQSSAEISRLAEKLVNTVSGDSHKMLTDRLQRMMEDVENYLGETQNRSIDCCNTLQSVQDFLEQLSQPLEGFQKMNKSLRMLGISTKIESSRLGELGSGFLNLAMDVEKLSYQVNDKSVSIQSHRQMMSSMITATLAGVVSVGASQKSQMSKILSDTAENLQQLVGLNNRCILFGEEVSSVSAEITGSISEIVSSMQSHDSTRQQLEHIIEALEKLMADMVAFESTEAQAGWRDLVVEAGDVCELQEAQLRFSSSEFCAAVRVIIENLQDVAGRQSLIASQIFQITGSNEASGNTVADEMRKGMTSLTDILASCAAADEEILATMRRVAQTITEITRFVSDIEEIGSEIDLIALNAQIKAAHTGLEGAALGVLAEAIKRLSDDAVRQTESVAKSLNGIVTATEHLSAGTEDEEQNSISSIRNMQDELDVVLKSLGELNSRMNCILSDLGNRVVVLNSEIEQATGGIKVDTQARQMSDEVLSSLDGIVAEARRLVPASSEFKRNLKHMEERYTMESERHIHESIARKRGAVVSLSTSKTNKAAPAETSEFGDNVDLF